MDALLDNAPGGFLRFTDAGVIVCANRTLLDWVQLSADAVIGQPITRLFSVGARIFYQTHVFPLLRLTGNATEIHLALRRADGRDVPVLVSAVRRECNGQMVSDMVLLTMHQRTAFEEALLAARQAAEAAHAELAQAHAELAAQKAALEEANVQLAELVTQDALTGLLNRRAFQERLAQALDDALRLDTPLSILLVDADHFKRINDTLGHPIGDDVLRALAELLRQSARQGDTVARYGGAEFALILPNTESADALRIAQRLCRAVAAAEICALPVTVSIGAATLGASITDADTLLSAADQALYAAKDDGRNRAVHAAQMAFLRLS
jgi:diguanylate cyclase (GGDEF)-like protein